MKFHRTSIRFKIIAVVLGISLPAVLLFFLLNTYAVERITEQLYENNKSLMYQHITDLESELQTALDILLELSISNSGGADFASEDPTKKYFATINYHNNNRNLLNRFKQIEGHAVFSPVNQNIITYFNGYGSGYKTREAVAEYIKENAYELASYDGRWKTVQVKGEWILLNACGNSRMVFCFWTEYKLLMQQTEEWTVGTDNHFCFTGKDGTLYSELSDQELSKLDFSHTTDQYSFGRSFQKYIISGIDSDTGDFRFVNIVESRALQKEVNLIQFLGIFLFLAVVLVGIPVIIRIFNKSIFQPVDLLKQGIHEVENGNLGIQIEKTVSCDEIEHLIDSFNRMISEVAHLKIETYEKSLEQQKMQLDYLNLQIEPHFYLNALNVISVHAQIGDTDNICQMIERLSSYMRYIMGSRKEMVSVREELEHVNNYLKIVESRLGSGFSYSEQVDKSLLEFSIPPLMLQTVVENSMKYAFDVYRETVIHVTIEKREDCVYFCITDNGEGFSDEYLERYNRNMPPVGSHIGLMNLRSRMNMLYGKKGSIRIFNLVPHGACTEIRICLPEDSVR